MTATVNGERATSVCVHVPWLGVWWADVELEEAPDVSGAVTIALSGLELRGTVVAAQAGTDNLRRTLRVVGGAGGWASLLPAKSYHNDASIRARTIIEDAAREAGETLGDVAPALERIGADYVRQAGPASRALEDVAGGAPWWVAYDGRTHMGTRPSVEGDVSLEVLEYDPRSRLATLVVDDLSTVGIGYVLSTSRLDELQTVRELELNVQADQVRVKAWCGGQDGARSRLGGALRSVIARSTDARLFGSWRYRVVQMSADRVTLQAVRRGAGLPDLDPVSMWPGMAGLHAELTPSVEVLVTFVEGDRSLPVITHFAGKDRAGWAPANLTLDATTLIKIGKDAASFAAKADLVSARVDTLQQKVDSHTHIYTLATGPGVSGGVPTATAAIASPIGPLAGVAAAKVKVQ